MKNFCVSVIAVLSVLNASAVTLPHCQQLCDSSVADTIVSGCTYFDSKEIDSIATGNSTTRLPSDGYDFSGNPLGKRIRHGFISFFERFSRLDSTYIEPQHYNYAAMVQNTNTYEIYRLTDNRDYSVVLRPEWSYKLGPYFGWRWIFLGYTLDINHLDFSHDDSQRQELDVSLYTNLFGIDLYYRKSGDDYKIGDLKIGNADMSRMDGVGFNGFHSSVKGFNIYYIFNHHKLSYPAAFSQSTVQRRSAGSVLAGFGYTVHKLSADWTRLKELIEDRMGKGAVELPDGVNFISTRIKYIDVSLSGGYAYNWVFARNCLLSASLSAAVAYKHSYGGTDETFETKNGFSFHNIGLDGVGRFAFVYNNSKWFFGMSSTLNAFNYNKSNFSINNIFGNLNFYIGFNFGRKKDEQ